MSKTEDEQEQILADLSARMAEVLEQVRYCLKLLDWVPDEEATP